MRLLLILLVALATLPAFAQETAADHTEPQDYPIDQLEAEAKPLRVDSLEELAEQWMGHLQQAVAAESQLILEGNATGEELASAEARRRAVAERLRVVVDSYEGKNGDQAKVDEYESYIALTSGSSVDWFDPAAVSSYASAWIVSPDGGIAVAVNIIKFIAILILSWIAARIAAMAVRAAVSRLPHTSVLLRDFAVTITKRIAYIIGFVLALGALGLNIGPLVAAIGAAGLVIGLALQGTLSNFASGVLILVYRPFDVGDAIKAGGVSGSVEAMNLVRTTILTWDNQLQFVPNNEIWDSVITNINGRDKRRVDLVFGIGYDDDIAKAEKIIADVLDKHELVLAEPAPNIRVNELADNSVNFVVRPWAKTSDYWTVYWDVTRAIKERFDAENVGIPYPQQDLHLPKPIEVIVKQGSITEPKGSGVNTNA